MLLHGFCAGDLLHQRVQELGFPQELPICYDDARPGRWVLVRAMEIGGIEAVREILGERVLVGVVTIEGLPWAQLMGVAEDWMGQHPEYLITYVTPKIVKALGPQAVGGLILGGGAGHYPPRSVGGSFGMEHLAQYSPFPNEAAYREIMPWAQEHKRPVLAICLGAQQVGLVLGAQLVRVGREDYAEPVRVSSRGALGRALMLAEDAGVEDEKVAELWVYRNHRFAVVADTLPQQVVIEARSAHGVLMAFSYEDWLWAVQFHPEKCIEGVAGGEASCESTLVFLRRFFERCL